MRALRTFDWLLAGVFSATAAADAGSKNAPKIVASCEPVVSCGCFIGCAEFRSVSDGKYSRVGEDADDQILYSRTADGYLGRGQEACDKSCAPSPAPFRCERTPTGTCEKQGPTKPDSLSRQLMNKSRELDGCFGAASRQDNAQLRVEIEQGSVKRALANGAPAATLECIERHARTWKLDTTESTVMTFEVHRSR